MTLPPRPRIAGIGISPGPSGCVNGLAPSALGAGHGIGGGPTGNAPNGFRVDPAGKRVKTVENQPNVRMVCPPHDLPCIAVVVHMATPGERLVSDTQAARRGQIGKVARCAVDPSQSLRMHRRADQHQIAAQLLHHIELAPRALDGLRPQRFGQPLEIAEGLEQHHLRPALPDKAPDGDGAAEVGNEILLENLDVGKPKLRDGLNLFLEVADP